MVYKTGALIRGQEMTDPARVVPVVFGIVGNARRRVAIRIEEIGTRTNGDASICSRSIRETRRSERDDKVGLLARIEYRR